MRGRVIAVILLGLVGGGLAGSRLSHARDDIAFMGDSLTLRWSFPRANFGVSGQTTKQMAERFPRQTKDKGFRRVLILGGTNDVLLGIESGETERNLGMMVDLARSEGMEPVLGEIPPIYLKGQDYSGKVAILNAGIVKMGTAKQVKVVNYFGALQGHTSAYSDGVHLKRVGYLRMQTALSMVENPY